MEKQKRNRTYRTTEQRAADIDSKISELMQTITKYEGLKSDLDAKIKKVKSRIALLDTNSRLKSLIENSACCPRSRRALRVVPSYAKMILNFLNEF